MNDSFNDISFDRVTLVEFITHSAISWIAIVYHISKWITWRRVLCHVTSRRWLWSIHALQMIIEVLMKFGIKSIFNIEKQKLWAMNYVKLPQILKSKIEFNRFKWFNTLYVFKLSANSIFSIYRIGPPGKFKSIRS